MRRTRHFVNKTLTASARLAEGGYALLIALLFIGTVGVIMMYYQLGNARNDRYQIYFAMGQEYAMIARAAHVYVQDHAYFSPYIVDPANSVAVAELNYYNSILTTRIATYREPLGKQANPGLNVITLEDLRTAHGYFGYVDAGMTFNRPVRGVQYTFRAHGGLVPMGAPKEVQASSSLLVMYGRRVGANADIRTIADMAAFRAGAASNGLSRIGIVLPPSQRANVKCRGENALVSWGNNESDCLTSAEAGTIGMSLDTFDVVAPAWEAVEKQLTQRYIYRRPHPGIYGTNIMMQEINFDGRNGKESILDAGEIYTQTVNIDTEGDRLLQVGQGAINGAPAGGGGTIGDAILTVSYGRNTRKNAAGKVDINSADSVCQGLNATTCFKSNQDLVVNGDMAVSYKADPKFPDPPVPPGTVIRRKMVDAQGVVTVATGNVTVSANDEALGFFDVTGGSGSSTFNINKQDQNGNGGTVINKKVTAKTFKVNATDANENFIVDKDLNIEGGNVQIGDASKPAQVIFTNAPLKSTNGTKLDIDTTGKGSNSGVYGMDTDAKNFTQTGSDAMTFENLHFDPGSTGTKPSVHIAGEVIIDPQNKFTDFDCVGTACPDQVSKQPEKDPL